MVIRSLTFYPFAYALLDDELNNYCWYCLKENSSENILKKCSLCKIALYCNKNCQNLGWLDHKPECKSFAEIAQSNDKNINGCGQTLLNLDVRMLARIVWRQKCIEKGGKFDSDDTFLLNRSSERTIMQICDHAEDMRLDTYAMSKFESIYNVLVKCFEKKYLCDKETVFQLHCRNFINRHSISDSSYMKEIAKGLYLDLCAYDHSCAPNTIYTCDGFIATLRPLSDDVDLMDRTNTFYTYIDLLASKQLRRKLLAETWYFTCRCTRCTNKDDHFLTSICCTKCLEAPAVIFDENDTLQKQTLCTRCKHPIPEVVINEAVLSMRSIDAIVNNATDHPQNLSFLLSLAAKYKLILHRSNIYYVKVLQAIIPLLDPENEVDKLLELHLEAVDCMKLCFPDKHPALAYHFLNLGIFSYKVNKMEDARVYLNESLSRLSYVLGNNHSMTKMCLDWLEKLT